MTESSDTSAIDEKKEESEPKEDNYITGVISFFTSSLATFLFILIYFALCGIILYSCKIAQSNILPTSINCFPYTSQKPTVEPIDTNIFTTLFTDPQVSMKLKIPYDKYDNSSNAILEFLKNYKETPGSNFLVNYFISILESLICFNYTSLNMIYNMMNGWPEIILIIFGPFLMIFVFFILIFFGFFYNIYLWFSKMSWFFKTNKNNTNEGKPKWEDISFFQIFNYSMAILLVITFIIVFFIIGFPLLSILNIITIVLVFFSIMSYKGELNGNTTTIFGIIQELYKYYKIPIMAFMTFNVVMLAFANLGSIAGLALLITIGLIYYGVVKIDLFNPVKDEKFSKLVSFKQAKKTCNIVENSIKKSLFNFFNFSGGGNIIKDLKHISKKMSK
jgi:hypothetical protein